jgi:L-alanine-DL-glutamate epimerase-like enolase superfamily enzyme
MARNVLLEITLAGGVRGWGEGAPFPAFNGETQADVLEACSRAGPLLEGLPIHDLGTLDKRLAEACQESPSARCAIETAIVDAQARLGGTSLRTVFGGAEEELVSDVTITTGSVEDATREACAFASFETLKMKVGGTDVDHDVARVRAVRAARPDARLLIDANGGFDVEDAVRFAREIAGVRVALFEQPVAPGSWEALAEVRRRTGLRIAIDESVTSANDVSEAKRYGAADAVNAKIMKSGIFEALAIVNRAREEGLDRMIGGMVETRLAMGTSACIAAGIGGFAFIDLDTPLFLAEDPFVGGYAQEGAHLDLRPIALGHGLTPR